MNLVHYLSQSTASIGVLGGIVGGTAAAAKNIKSLKNGEISQSEAALDVGKETVGAGVATAAAAVAAGMVGSSVLISAVTVIGVGTGAKYFWDMGVEKIEERFVVKDELDAELATEE